MASLVSIGDALLLAQIAWKLGRAFTKGRKSSISEFREVENQLFALGAALSALHDSGLAQNGDYSNALNTMLENCRATLMHLQSKVDEYCKLGDTRNDTEAPAYKRWSSKLQKEWKTIKWTTEGGDLANLRSQLMVHINTLNLIMSITSNLQISKTHDQLAEMMAMMNVLVQENRRGTMVNRTSHASFEPLTQETIHQLTFHLYVHSASENTLICDHASIHPDWALKTSRATNRPSQVARDRRPFVCRCQSEGTGTTTPHQYRLDAFTLSEFTFAIRQAGQELSWLLYKMSDMHSSMQTSLIIKSLDPTRLRDFEDRFIQALSVDRATKMLTRDLHTDLAYTSIDANGNNEVHILGLIADVSDCSKLIEMVTFTANSTGKTYSRKDVETANLYHYRKADFRILKASEGNRSFSPQEFAEIVICYPDTARQFVDADISKTTLRLAHNTDIRHNEGDKTVAFPKINCTESDFLSAIESNMEIHFKTSQGAFKFYERCLHMRKELFILSLKYPGPYETIVLKLQAGAVQTEHISIAESDITIVQDSRTGIFRLFVVSHDGRTVLSQRLPWDFMGFENGSLNFRAPTWLIHINERGKLKQKRYKKGFEHFVLSDFYTQEIFREWAQSQLPESPNMARGIYGGAARPVNLLA
ncbi:hypothetical protein V8E54_000908 [Elaphomyces granulatus]